MAMQLCRSSHCVLYGHDAIFSPCEENSELPNKDFSDVAAQTGQSSVSIHRAFPKIASEGAERP